MPQQTIQVDSLAEAYLSLLADRGVDYLFGNAGTDFASVIEALSKAATPGHVRPGAGHRAAREPRGVDGAWLFPGDRPAPGGDGPCQCRHRQTASAAS